MIQEHPQPSHGGANVLVSRPFRLPGNKQGKIQIRNDPKAEV